MHITALFSVALATASVAISQTPTTVAFLQSVGPNQSIPDPITGATGPASLFGIFGPAAGANPPFIRFALNGVPGGYGSASPITQELVIFALDFGVPPASFTPLLGGEIWMPNPATAPVTFTAMTTPSSSSGYLGPLDTVPIGGTSGGVQDPMNNGGRLDLSSLFVPAAVGVDLTIQGGLLDPVINRLFTSNAIRFRVQ